MQSQIQIDQQLQQQKQDLVHCNNSFGMLLSSLESFFIKSGYKITVLFGYYNHFNDISWKSLEEIKSQLYIDLMLYKMQKEAFYKKYKEIYFPDYPPIKEIIQVIVQWKNNAKNKEERKLCDEVLDLINDKNAKSMSYYYEKIEKIKCPSKVDPIKGFQMSNKIHNIMDKRDEKIFNELRKDPNTKFGLEIGKPIGNSEFSHLGNNIDITNTKSQEQLNFEEEIIIKLKSLFKIIKDYDNGSSLNLGDLYENYSYIKIKFSENKDKDLEFIFRKIKIDHKIKRIDNLIKKEKNQEYLKAFTSVRELLLTLNCNFYR